MDVLKPGPFNQEPANRAPTGADQLPPEVQAQWAALHAEAAEQYDLLAPTPQRVRLFVKGLVLIGSALRPVSPKQKPANRASTGAGQLPPEVQAQWAALHRDSIEALKNLDPTFMTEKEIAQMSARDRVLRGLAFLARSVDPRPLSKDLP